MAWWSASSVTVVNNATLITVNNGDAIDNIRPTDAIVIGGNIAEIKRAYFNGTNNIIELVVPWSAASQTAQPAKSFPTDADLANISKSLSTFLNNFTKATQSQMQAGTDNTAAVTPLNVKQAIEFFIKSAGFLDATTSHMDFTENRAFRVGDLGIGKFLDLRTAYSNFDTPQKCYGKGTLFGFIDGAALGIPNYTATHYGVLTIHSQYSDASGTAGTCQEFRYGADVWIRAYASATVWTSWTKLLKTGDNGFGTQLAGIKDVYSVLTPAQVVANFGSGVHYSGNVLNHGASAPEPWGMLGGYISDANSYTYSYQEFTGIYATKYRRTANAGGAGWSEWRKVLEKNDFGVGGTGGTLTRCSDANALTGTGHYWTSDVWTGSPISGSHSRNQGYLIHQDWGTDNNYATQHFYTMNGGDINFTHVMRRKDLGVWGQWITEGDLVSIGGGTRVSPKFNSMAGIIANDITTPGWYINVIDADSSSNMPVTPVAGTKYWFLEVMYYSAGDVTVQRAHNYTFNDGNGKAGPMYVFQRVRSGSVGWTAWQPIVYPQVGQVGYDSASGYNVGAVLEYGTNANGSYLKFADGTMVCWGVVTQTGLTINPAKTGYNNTAFACTPTFPHGFAGGYTLTIGQKALYDATDQAIYTISAAGGAGNHLLLNLGTLPAVQWPRLDDIGTSVAVKAVYSWSAVGRWRT